MESLMVYLVKANVLFTILFLAYILLLKNEKTFNANRGFLLSALVMSVLLPLLPVVNFVSKGGFPDYVTAASPVQLVIKQSPWPDPVHLGHQVSQSHGFISNLFSVAGISGLLTLVYLLVAFILLNRFIWQLYNLFALYKAGKSYRAGDVIYCEHNRKLSPFSFFKILFINPHTGHRELDQIIAHEKIHIRQWHSVDVLFTEMVGILLWLNPVTIWFKRYTKLNLEYIADAGVLSTGIDKKQYQLSLLYSSVGEKAYPLTNLFNSSKLKLRIKMINQSKKTGWYKYLLVLPLVLVGYLLINPNTASSANVKVFTSDDTPMKAFEGIYQNKDQPSAYVQMTAAGSTLIVKRLDFPQQYTLKRTADLTFELPGMKAGESLQVTFTKNDAGEIAEVRVGEKTPWVKVKEYKPAVVVTLTPGQLKAVEGKYQFESNKKAFLTITANGNSITMNTLWDGKKKENLVPLSDHEFLNIEEAFDLKFVKDSSGKVVKMIAYKTDQWDKVN